MNEMELLDQNELVADVVSSIQQYGAKRLAEELRKHFPDHFRELLIQMQRHEHQTPKLFKP